jgi:hypothetical protein
VRRDLSLRKLADRVAKRTLIFRELEREVQHPILRSTPVTGSALATSAKLRSQRAVE